MIPPFHAINLLLNIQHSKNQPLYRFAISKLTKKQYKKLKSPIKDINERLSEVTDSFNTIHLIFFPGSRVVDHFPSHITFHSLASTSDNDLHSHMQKLNLVFCQTQSSLHDIAVIADGEVKKSNVAVAVTHIWKNDIIINCPQIQTMNATLVKAELMTIYISLILVMNSDDTHNITVITDSIKAAKYITESKANPLQNLIIPLVTKIKNFFCKDRRNKIQFWFCPNKAEWPKHKLVDNQVKAAMNNPILPSRNSVLASKKKECNNILKE